MAKRKRRESRERLDRPGLDIVIPIYGRADILKRCLAALPMAALSTNYRLILVDDSSPQDEEDSLGIIYNHIGSQPNVLIIQNSGKNMGFAWTCNHGASIGNAPNILFLNSDVILDAGAIDRMIASLYAPSPEIGLSGPPGSETGIVGIKLLFPEEANDSARPAGRIQHAGIAFNMSGLPFHIHIGWGADHLAVNVPMSMQAVTGACLMIRRDLWKTIEEQYKSNGERVNGAFNNVYGLGTFEDIELCFAARQAGFNVVYEPRAVGRHFVGASIAKLGQPYPIPRNMGIFKARCGPMVVWDEFMLY